MYLIKVDVGDSSSKETSFEEKNMFDSIRGLSTVLHHTHFCLQIIGTFYKFCNRSIQKNKTTW